jgi:hypothetical protein
LESVLDLTEQGQLRSLRERLGAKVVKSGNNVCIAVGFWEKTAAFRELVVFDAKVSRG